MTKFDGLTDDQLLRKINRLAAAATWFHWFYDYSGCDLYLRKADRHERDIRVGRWLAKKRGIRLELVVNAENMGFEEAIAMTNKPTVVWMRWMEEFK